MANCIGYEELTVGPFPVGPTAALIKGGVACAVFYVDPRTKGRVRWKPKAIEAVDYPTASSGFPLARGKWISVAGEGVIRNSKFVLDGEAEATSVKVYVLYFDRVDVVAADFTENVLPDIEATLKRMEVNIGDMLEELRKHTTALEGAVQEKLEPART